MAGGVPGQMTMVQMEGTLLPLMGASAIKEGPPRGAGRAWPNTQLSAATM
jgi:hypothetical protein